jgi:hypothetical protein
MTGQLSILIKPILLRTLLAGLFLVFLDTASQGQTLRSFTHERQAFVDELTAIMVDADKKEGKPLMEEKFGPFWINGSLYNEEQEEQIYNLADGLLKKRMRPFPFFQAFITSIMSFPGSPQEGKGFDTWVNTMNLLMKGSKSKIEDYLLTSELLFKSNTFYESSSNTWKVDNSGWNFGLEGDVAYIDFPNINLTCLAKGDSSVIYATSGRYDIQSQSFVGKDGKITWERAELDPNETYAVIDGRYDLQMRSSTFKIDSVQFFTTFFKYPLLGEVEDKILANVTPDKATFPQFSSYEKRLSIDNIFDKVDYNGGFRMEGANLKGYGSPEEPAMLTFKRDNLPQLIALAQFYTIKPDRVSSRDTEVIIILNNDSIVHPSVQLRYRNENRLLSLIRTDEGLSKSPYYNTYHMVDMYFEAFYWNIDDPVMRMGNLFGSTETRAAFESTNFFKSRRYYSLQGMDNVNPLFAIRSYARKVNSNNLDARSLAADLGYSLESYIPVLIDLSNKGFVNYNIANERVQVKQKLYDYISAAAGNIDYDVILFNSDVKNADNAELNLVNFDLVLRGVDQILLSDSQNVVIYPKNGEVNLRKNRDFNFGGVIRSGRFEFFGEEYKFDYNKFLIELIAVDSCRLYVEDFSPDSKRLRRVENVLEGIVGTLQIDNPFNKSGLQEEFTEYPILTSDQESFVYYDRPGIQGGVYERDKVFFELEPFVLDSLDNFATEQVAFQGKFYSGGIFPDLEEKLRVQEDYSLGFERNTPADGLPLYGDKAVFKNEIILNGSGIQGNGDLEFLTSISSSDLFTFFPDSTKGVTTAFVNNAQLGPPEIPEANADEVGLSFYPIEEELVLEVLENPINMFEGQAIAKAGQIDLNEKGLTGDGIVEFSGAELESKLIEFNYNTFSSDTADFRLLALQEANLAFRTDNVNAFIDFDERIGKFKSNGDETKVEFPVNEYICFMDEFKWFMDKNDISLETSRQMATDFVIDTELDMNRSNFFSVNKDQDSLNFMSPKAVYDLDSYTITADQIPWIRVADAKITPDSGRVIIRRRAKMDPLQDATILANYVTQYHTVTSASVNILSRFDYVGSGNYAYTDENKQQSIITLETIGVDSSLQTVASGRLTEDDEFFLSPHFEYQGRVFLKANDKFLTFDGSTRIIHDCERLERNWMKFNSTIDPENVSIALDTVLVDLRGRAVDVGMKLAKDPFELYATFISAARDDSDQDVLTSRGVLRYNKGSQTYEVAQTDKLNQKSLPGNYISLNKQSCEISGNGNLELSDEKGIFDLKTIGKLSYKPVDERIKVQASVSLGFPFSEPGLEKMTAYFNSLPDLKPVDLSKSNYEYAIKELMGLEASDKVISELNLSGTIKKLPDELNKTIFISDVELEWDPILESFVSKGDIGIASIGKQQFFRKVPGKFVVEKKASGDIIHLYLEINDANWYYFTYKRGLLQTYSSDKEFNAVILEEKEDKRKTPGAKKEDNYMYMLGSRSKQNIFVDQFMF